MYILYMYYNIVLPICGNVYIHTNIIYGTDIIIMTVYIPAYMYNNILTIVYSCVFIYRITVAKERNTYKKLFLFNL